MMKRICIYVTLITLLLSPNQVLAKWSTLFEGDSAYTNIRIADREDGLRYMYFGAYEQTIMKMDDPAYIHYPYIRSLMAGFALAEKPIKRVLLLGLGGGTIPQVINKHFPEVEIDIYEIDPMVVELAEKYFQFKPGIHGKVMIGDGRRLLKKSKKEYDLVILDAYKAGGIPFHLTTKEFMELVKERLSPAGIAVAHLWAEYANKYLKAQVKTIASVFPRAYSFYDNDGSFQIFASKGDYWIEKNGVLNRAVELSRVRKLGFDLGRVVAEQYLPHSQIPTSGLDGIILTDDFAPVNLLRHQK